MYLAIRMEVKGKNESTLEHSRTNQMGWVFEARPGRFTAGKETRYPLYRRLGGTQVRAGRVRKTSRLRKFHPRTVQPVASRYTD